MSQPISISGAFHTSHQPQHTYRPIRHGDAIRLIHLHPSVDDSAPITFSILRARLSDAKLEYEALSYTWGTQYPKRKVFCRNPPSVLEVTQNCYSSLRRLRNDSTRSLWIDAICINQEDNDERSAQVRMMDRIFARASGVIVDLGEETPGSQLLFNELAEAEQSHNRTGKYMRPWPNDRTIQELECLYRRPWFSRIWVVQEVVANPSVRIMCGTHKSSWATLDNCNYGYSETRVTMKEDPPILRIKSWLPEYKSPTGLWKILIDTRSLFASDPRDRIFSLLSLLGPSLDIRDQLIDYSQSSEDVFTRVGKLLLSQVGLRLLTAARHGHVRAMPSWVPDWSHNYSCDWLRFRYGYGDDEAECTACETGPLGLRHEEHAEPRNTPKASGFKLLSVGKHVCALKVKGIRFSTVMCQSATFSFSSFDDAEQAFLELLGFFHYSHSDEHLLSRTKGISLPSDLLAALRRQRPSNSSEFVEWISRGRCVMEPFDSDSQKVDIRLKADDGFFFPPETVQYFRDAMNNCRLFVTEGDEIGIAPYNTREGDVVCIIKGAFAPCILRQIAQDQWSLISGDCYLCQHEYLSRHAYDDYLPDSEVLHFAGAQDINEEDFIIC